MTLNLTVTTPRCIYQCADYRLRDTTTGKTFDFQTQKIALAGGYGWDATVCFAGVGRTPQGIDVAVWLGERIRAIGPKEPFERLLDELLTANAWLTAARAGGMDTRHSFSVGAFIEDEPVFALISNFEYLDRPADPNASPALQVHRIRPTGAKTFVSGFRSAVVRQDRRQLAALAARDPATLDVFDALSRANRSAAAIAKRMGEPVISPECFTTYVRLTGEAGGRAYAGNQPVALPPRWQTTPELDARMKEILEKQYPGGYRLVQTASARMPATERAHQVQLREKPLDPATHNNYGAFLMDVKKDPVGAESAYREALKLNPKFVLALGNLANVLWNRGDHDEAADLYQQARDSGPPDENVTWNHARFLHHVRGDRTKARAVLSEGIGANPQSGRLLMLRAELAQMDGDTVAAMQDVVRAREVGWEQKEVEAAYACSLHASGAPIGECIAAYRVAIGLNPAQGNLRLNLAQLLFIRGDTRAATTQLEDALKLGLDDAAQLEANFYFLAHTQQAPAPVIDAIRALLARGARLAWNVDGNIASVAENDQRKAARLREVVEAMTGRRDLAAVQWPA